MRTTLTLDDDVAAKLRAEMRKSGKSFNETVNEYLRLGLSVRREMPPAKPFKVRPTPIRLRPGFSLDCIGRLLEQVEELERLEESKSQ